MNPHSHTNRLILALAADYLTKNGHLTLHEPNSDFANYYKRRVFDCYLDGNIPALIQLSNCYRDEWHLAVILWPVGYSETRHCTDFSETMGLATAFGWLNRWMSNGRNFEIERFHNATADIHSSKRIRVAAISTPVTGLGERLMRFHSRPSTKIRKPKNKTHSAHFDQSGRA